MPFQKGNTIAKLKGKHEKTKQWEALGDAIMSIHTERFNQILSECEPEKFMTLYLQVLEYFKPKLQRTEHSGNIQTTETVTFKIAGQEIPYQKVTDN